jgi:hypothetical protein
MTTYAFLALFALALAWNTHVLRTQGFVSERFACRLVFGWSKRWPLIAFVAGFLVRPVFDEALWPCVVAFVAGHVFGVIEEP